MRLRWSLLASALMFPLHASMVALLIRLQLCRPHNPLVLTLFDGESTSLRASKVDSGLRGNIETTSLMLPALQSAAGAQVHVGRPPRLLVQLLHLSLSKITGRSYSNLIAISLIPSQSSTVVSMLTTDADANELPDTHQIIIFLGVPCLRAPIVRPHPTPHDSTS